MTQATLFDEPDVYGVAAPSGVIWQPQCPLPVAPSAVPQARHASATGAQYAAVHRGALTLRYLDLLARLGRLSDHEAAGMLGVGLSSINSTRAKLGAAIAAAPEALDDVHHWPTGHTTRRTRWQLAPVQTEGGLA
jgi:hypothetical protein